MKNWLFLIFAFPFCVFGQVRSIATEAVEPPRVENMNGDEIHTVVEEQAEYPGGREAMYKFIQENFVYPQEAVEDEIQGKVFIRFVVDEAGRVSDAKVLRGIPGCAVCGAEALRVVNRMPNWKPAKSKGKNVKCYYTLPFTFKLTDE